MRPIRHPNLRYDDYAHPASIDDLVAIVTNARAAGAQVRVRGSLHAEPGSVLGDGFSPDGRRRPIVQVMLDRLSSVTIDQTSHRARVQAGMSMGGDPHAIGAHNPQGNRRYSLFEEFDRAGYALEVTGGISHQTISGFLSTGSAGGSLMHSFHDAIRSLTFVDGRGQVITLARGDADFPAALVSLGLFGILAELELDLAPRYAVKGRRSVQADDDCDYDLFGDFAAAGRPTLEDLLTQHPYSRLMWWPQPGVQRVELWEARRASEIPPVDQRVSQADGVIGPVFQWLARFLYAAGFEAIAPGAGEGEPSPRYSPRRIYELLTAPARFVAHALDNTREELSPHSPTRLGKDEIVAILGAILHARSLMPPKTWDPMCGPPPSDEGGGLREALAHLFKLFRDLPVAEASIASTIEAFVPLSPASTTPWTDELGHARHRYAEYFYDIWKEALPMDDPMHDRFLAVRFTELWLPMEKARPAMRALRDHYRRTGLAGTGTFTVEVYGAKQSEAWLSAAYDRDVVRFDPFRFDDGDERGRRRFFDQFFEVLRPFEPRFHLGKALSDPWSSTGVDYRKHVMPKLDDFLARRTHYDPDDVFLTRYWAEHFGIVPATP